jgi:DNA-binding FadR family transcriptional regulator
MIQHERISCGKKVQDEVEEFIASHELKTHHYLPDKEIIAEFSMYKKKHVREAISNLR